MIKSAEIQRSYPLGHGGRPLEIVFLQHSVPKLCLPLYCHTTPNIIKEGGFIGGCKPRNRGGGSEGAWRGDLNKELNILLNLIKNGREGWGNLKKINLKNGGVSEGAGFNQELNILFNSKQR